MIFIAIIQDSLEFVSPTWEFLKTSSDFRVNAVYFFPEDAMKGLRESLADIVILDLHSPHHGGMEWKIKLAGNFEACCCAGIL